MSILHLCKVEQFQKVKELLKQSKYDAQLLDEQDNGGRCALHYSVLSDQPSICELLLRSGASPNIQDGQGNSALHLSLSQIQSDQHSKLNKCTQILCDTTISCYDWTLQDAFGRTVLHWICAHGYDGILKQITNESIPTIQHNDNKMDEERKSNDNDIRYSVFSAFNLENKSGQTCMHWAVDKQNWSCVYLLLEIAEKNGSLDLTLKDKDGLLAYDLCLEEHAKQQIWDQTIIQIKEKERKRKENSVPKFSVNTSTSNKKKNGVSTGNKKRALKMKGKGKKKMKIKLKK